MPGPSCACSGPQAQARARARPLNWQRCPPWPWLGKQGLEGCQSGVAWQQCSRHARRCPWATHYKGVALSGSDGEHAATALRGAGEWRVGQAHSCGAMLWARNAVGRSPSCGNIQGLNNARPMPCCSFHTQLDKTSVFEI